MVVKKDPTGNSRTIYECDRCHKIVVADKNEVFKIQVRNSPRFCKVIISWDLCKRCYASLHKGIEKGVSDKK